tara:strand:+ start:6107 stop:6988 length:882 start_codon:yes stop_codon:yes gene_type:complete
MRMAKDTYSQTISPKQFGQVIGMSESSLKRWVDSGHLHVTRTVGGHRRISIKEALRFIRSRSLKVRDSSPLRMTVNTESFSTDDCNSLFMHYLKKGMAEEARQLIFNEFIKGATLAELGDGLFKTSLEIISLEGNSANNILIEHRATQICIQIINSLHELIVEEKTLFQAVGGAISGDVYALPSMLVAAVLKENHGAAINLGPNTPLDVFREASVRLEQSKKPDLVWISISELKNPRELSEELSRFAHECDEDQIELIIGGRAAGKLTLDHKTSLTLHASLNSISKQLIAFKK